VIGLSQVTVFAVCIGAVSNATAASISCRERSRHGFAVSWIARGASRLATCAKSITVDFGVAARPKNSNEHASLMSMGEAIFDNMSMVTVKGNWSIVSSCKSILGARYCRVKPFTTKTELRATTVLKISNCGRPGSHKVRAFPIWLSSQRLCLPATASEFIGRAALQHMQMKTA